MTLAAITGAVFAWRWRGTEAPSDATVRATIPLVGGGVLGTDGQPAIALSADGTRLVYVASVNSRTSLYFRRLDQLDSVLLPGTDGASAPFFAADGNSVGFFADRKLKRVSFDGAHAIIICDAPRGRGGAWETNDTIVFAPTSDGPLFRVSATGGRPEPITSLDQSPRERSHRWPELLPGGRTVLYTSGNPTDTTLSDSRIVVESVGDPSSRRVLVENSSYARYSAGHLLYVMGSALMAVRFDPAGAKITGSPFTVVNAVSNSRYVGSAQMSASRDGTLIYVSPGGGGYMTTAWVTRQGVPSPLAGVEGLLTSVRLSPDERRIAFNSAEGDADIHVYDIARQSLERITFGPEFEGNPVWTPDGTRIVYASDRGPAVQMYWKRWDDPRGSPGALAQRPAGDEALAPGDYARIPHVWSPDGNLLAFTENHPESRRDIWLMQKGPGAKAVPFVASPFEDNYPAFSPDGRWLAYQSNDSGGDEIYARRLEGDSPRVQLTPAGGAGPRWAANGDLFYWSAGRMFAVPVSTQDDTLRVGAHQQLFPVASLPFFDVTADGQRLIMLRLDDPPPAHQLIVVHNWVSPARSR